MTSNVIESVRGWSQARLALPDQSNAESRRIRLAIICAVVFAAAFGVRLLHWRDSHVEIERGDGLISSLVLPYRAEARRMIDDGGLLFSGKEADPRDARMILHPPGYSILIAAIYGGQSTDGSYSCLRLVQIISDSAAAVMIVLVAAELFPLPLAALAGLLVALSPHLAHYSLWLSPDTLAALPVVACVFLVIKASKRPRLVYIIAAGFALGLSCWVRSNALLLAFFLVPLIFLLFEGRNRIRYSVALVSTMLAVIAPITIRNWIVYRSLIPLSLGAGITLIEGIADYDEEGRFGMPATDRDVAAKDVEWHNRDEYAGNIWVPDGLERDRYRFARGLEVIKANPGWFVGVMFRRAASMLRYNDSFSDEKVANIGGRVPVVSAEPPFAHQADDSARAQITWEGDPAKLMSEGALLSPLAENSLSAGGQALQVKGDGTGFDDQFTSAPIPVEANTDYVLQVQVRAERGNAAVKLTSVDRRITLASGQVGVPDDRPKRRAKRKAEQQASNDLDESDDRRLSVLAMPFASGKRSEVRLVISNNDADSSRPVVEIGAARLFRIGATPAAWSGFVRQPIRGAQKYLFTTSRMLALVVAGIILLALARRSRALLILLAAPAYYLILQSVFHTEYRYILAIHYFFFIIASAALYCAGILSAQVVGLIKRESLKRIKN